MSSTPTRLDPRSGRSAGPQPRSDEDLDVVLAEVAEAARPRASEGAVADYIPALGSADPDGFAIALAELDGEQHLHGDVDTRFPIQSISKVFALVLAMQKIDATAAVSEELWSRVGREPSGDPFNSLVQLEYERGIPRNPMINAGALVVDDALLSFCDDAKGQLTELVSELAGEPIEVDADVARSEGDVPHRNLAVANLMASFGNVHNSVQDVLDVYVHQCSLTMSARQLARAIRFLANDGIDPASGHRVLSDALARRVTALMLTCGTYDAAGAFAYDVGLPCKSGVAGGIVTLVPDRMGACVWSPPLDGTGNSLAGRVALHHLAERLNLSIF